MSEHERVFSPAEAAVVTGVSIKLVHREIDQGPLNAAHGDSRNKRSLRERDLLYLAAANCLDSGLVQLTRKGKKKLYEAISAYCQRNRTVHHDVPLFEGGFSLDLKRVLKLVRTKIALLDRTRKEVLENPCIRGGEPCIFGTRIGVYEIAAMLEQGESKDEILAGYPSLRPEHLEIAYIYAQAYPKRGRPPRHPWHSGEARML